MVNVSSAIRRLVEKVTFENSLKDMKEEARRMSGESFQAGREQVQVSWGKRGLCVGRGRWEGDNGR